MSSDESFSSISSDINDQKKTYKNNLSNILFDNDEPGPSQPIEPKRGRGRPSKNSQITITSAKKRDAKSTSDAAVSQTQNKKRRI
ncbi:hypothetical protein BpHYR1_011451 [Brachionus plicatilis]|uniref:Uncharacterized protein n=1 Tax=Brachionus plicatilis TaxID=10195 RepID=A0A3M7QFF8_BRAPC|nr:hypothetical protein BpHYR1_011451 [Brachionus plicatilis]